MFSFSSTAVIGVLSAPDQESKIPEPLALEPSDKVIFGLYSPRVMFGLYGTPFRLNFFKYTPIRPVRVPPNSQQKPRQIIPRSGATWYLGKRSGATSYLGKRSSKVQDSEASGQWPSFLAKCFGSPSKPAPWYLR